MDPACDFIHMDKLWHTSRNQACSVDFALRLFVKQKREFKLVYEPDSEVCYFVDVACGLKGESKYHVD